MGVPGLGVEVRVAAGGLVAARVGCRVGGIGVMVTIGVTGRSVGEAVGLVVGEGVSVGNGVSLGGSVLLGVGWIVGVGSIRV